MSVPRADDPFEALVDEQFDTAEPYSFFRARAREALARAGWVCRDSDDESDYFVNGRWWIYTSPGDRIFEFDSVVIFEFASAEVAEISIREEADEPIKVAREFTVQDALRYVDERARARQDDGIGESAAEP